MQRHMGWFYLSLFTLLGLALGHLAATVLGVYLSPAVQEARVVATERRALDHKTALTDYRIILERNIFDSSAAGAVALDAGEKAPRPAAAAAAPRVDLKLFGTVAAGGGSLALIKAGRETALYHLDDEVPGGGRIEAIARNLVEVRNRDGSLATLPLYGEEQARQDAPASGGGKGGQIRSVGENRWLVDRKVAEKARSNIGELLKSARMEPNLVAGRTEGFAVKMIRPKSLLAQLGIRKGDVVMQVNGVALDSPEKGLQIFQQLREAKQISIALRRNGTPMNLEYEMQ